MLSGNIYKFCDRMVTWKEVISIQVLLWILALIFCIFIFACLFILVCPCHYYIEGKRRGNFKGVLAIKIAFFKVRLFIVETGNNQWEFYIWRWKLKNVQRQDLREAKKKRHSNRFTIHNLSTWLRELDEAKLNLLIELSLKIYQEMRPQQLLLKGKLGFANPYYTGLLAAVLFCIPIEKINIEPVFFEPVCELTIQLRGQINLGLLVYYSFYFLIACPLRVILWENSKNKREEKGYGL